MNVKKIVALLALAALIAVPIVINRNSAGKGLEIEAEAAGARTLRASVLASGSLIYEQQVQLTSEVIGKVSAIHVKEGDAVKADQIVLQLDERQFRAEVEQQDAARRQYEISIERQQLNVANEERQFKRYAELHARKLIDETKFDEAKHRLSLAKLELRQSREALQQVEAQLKQARERLAKTTIRAPISGTVTALDIKVGETAVPSTQSFAGSALMTVADTASMVLEANIDEADIGQLVLGQDAEIFAAAYPDNTIKGKVEHIPLSPRRASAAMQTQGSSNLSRTYSVRLTLLDTANLNLRPGMTCRTEIFYDTRGDSLSVPIQAVVDGKKADGDKKAKDDSYAVWVIEDGKAKRRDVTLGVADDHYQQILSGVKAGDQIITGPAAALRQLSDGRAVTIKSKTAEEKNADAKGADNSKGSGEARS